jgi:hypothetical protein
MTIDIANMKMWNFKYAIKKNILKNKKKPIDHVKNAIEKHSWNGKW